MSSYRFYGFSVRPVYGDKVRVTGISLFETNLQLNVGQQSGSLCATITPSNAAEQGVCWSSSDTGVATVDQNGKVTAVKVGNATITVTTTDGGHTASCSVTVKSSEPGPTPENPLVGTSWTCSFSEIDQYCSYYCCMTLTFDSSNFSMTIDEISDVKEHYIYYDFDYNGDGKIDQYDCSYVEGGKNHNSHSEYGTYKVTGSLLELSNPAGTTRGTISGNTITIDSPDAPLVFQKQ